MTRYLLDTNIVSGLMRPVGAILGRLKLVGEANVYTSIMVAAELRFGAAWKGSERLAREVEDILERLTVAPFEAPGDRIYGELRAELRRTGTAMGGADLWIAAQALMDGSVLVTDNVRDFGRVPKLRVENWLRD